MKTMLYWANPDYQPTLQAHGIDQAAGFDRLWAIQKSAVEPGNFDRGGESSVIKWSFPAKESGQNDISTHHVFIKRQRNHLCRTWHAPFRGEPTFSREFRNLLIGLQKNLPVVRPIFYQAINNHGVQSAILVTEDLEYGFKPLNALLPKWKSLRKEDRARMIQDIALAIRALHNAGIAHRCLYPQHIFIANNPPATTELIDRIRFIDLEKGSRIFFSYSRVRDLETLDRRTQKPGGPSRTERLRFILTYLRNRPASSEAMSAAEKRFIGRILNREKD
jgi:hypothetical protein